MYVKFGKEFFEKAFETNEVSDAEKEIRGDEVEVVEQVKEDTPPVKEIEAKVDEKKAEDTKPVEKEPESPPNQDGEIQKFVIDGEEMTLEQIRELKKGNMRQDDYTRKTQELANQRKEVEKLKQELESSPEADKVAMKEKMSKLEYDLANKELETELAHLKEKYPDFDEVKVLTEANKRKMYDDLEFIYKATRDIDASKQNIDVKKLEEEAIKKYKETLQKELQKDKEKTAGSIISDNAGQAPIDYTEMVSEDEKAYCKKRGITIKSFVEMRDAEYKI